MAHRTAIHLLIREFLIYALPANWCKVHSSVHCTEDPWKCQQMNSKHEQARRCKCVIQECHKYHALLESDNKHVWKSTASSRNFITVHHLKTQLRWFHSLRVKSQKPHRKVKHVSSAIMSIVLLYHSNKRIVWPSLHAVAMIGNQIIEITNNKLLRNRIENPNQENPGNWI